jgi:hypothetical protein
LGENIPPAEFRMILAKKLLARTLKENSQIFNEDIYLPLYLPLWKRLNTLFWVSYCVKLSLSPLSQPARPIVNLSFFSPSLSSLTVFRRRLALCKLLLAQGERGILALYSYSMDMETRFLH